MCQLQGYYKYFESKRATTEEICGIILSGILSFVMGKRYIDTGKIMPAGLVGFLSILMTLFFAYRLVYPARLPPVKKKAT